MRTLTGSSIPNINTSDLANYPKGRHKDKTNPSSTDGTELSERTFGDLYQGVVELLRLAEITPSEAAEKKAVSDIADAVGFLKPIAILRCGINDLGGTVGVQYGKYVAGYSALFVYDSFDATGKFAKYKLTIKKDGSVSATEKYYVDASMAHGVGSIAGTTDTVGRSASAYHKTVLDAAPHNYEFQNDTVGNITVNAGAVSDVAESDLEGSNFLITIYKG